MVERAMNGHVLAHTRYLTHQVISQCHTERDSTSQRSRETAGVSILVRGQHIMARGTTLTCIHILVRDNNRCGTSIIEEQAADNTSRKKKKVSN